MGMNRSANWLDEKNPFGAPSAPGGFFVKQPESKVTSEHPAPGRIESGVTSEHPAPGRTESGVNSEHPAPGRTESGKSTTKNQHLWNQF
jgi:hypothetical protein